MEVQGQEGEIEGFWERLSVCVARGRDRRFRIHIQEKVGTTMHYSHVVMLHGCAPEEFVESRYRAAMEPYDEANDSDGGRWDWHVVGGRWGNTWVLRTNGVDGPLATESHSGGLRPPREDSDRRHTDCARLRDLELESLSTPYSWIDLDGIWHTKWLGREKSGSDDYKAWEIAVDVWEKRWLQTVTATPADAWLVHVDYHG